MGLSEILQYLCPVCWVEQDRTDAEFLSSIEDQNIESSILKMFLIVPSAQSVQICFLVYILKEKRFYWKFAQKFMSEYSSYVPMIFVCPIPQNEVILSQ